MIHLVSGYGFYHGYHLAAPAVPRMRLICTAPSYPQLGQHSAANQSPLEDSSGLVLFPRNEADTTYPTAAAHYLSGYRPDDVRA